jgi:hypothetical protein
MMVVRAIESDTAREPARRIVLIFLRSTAMVYESPRFYAECSGNGTSISFSADDVKRGEKNLH